METLNKERMIEVGMGEMKTGESPCKMITRGLGSCVAITLYDPVKKIGGMAHAMLPDIEKVKLKSNPRRFVNYVIRNMLEDLQKQGCAKERIVAKLFGGARMFSFITSESILNVGEKNVLMAKTALNELGIKLSVEETGGTFGRTTELNLETGKVLLKTISWGDKEL